MKLLTLAVALLALGAFLPAVNAQERSTDEGRDVTYFDQATLDCLLRFAAECFVTAPRVGNRDLTLEPYGAPGCEAANTRYYVGGRDVNGDGSTDTPHIEPATTAEIACPTIDDRQHVAPSDELGASSHCGAWVHLHGSYSGGAWQGGVVAHMHHNNYANCHLAGGYWSYTGNCGSASYYSHDSYYIGFCDYRYHDVCINLRTQNNEWTGWRCWRQYN